MKRFILCIITIIISTSLCMGTVLAKKKTKEVKASADTFSLTESATSVKETQAVLYTDADLKYLACIIYAEAGNQCYDGKVAVGQVVLNRVASKDFPGSVKKVIYDHRGGSVQFSPTANGSYARTLKLYKKKGKLIKECIRAAKDAFKGKNVIGDKLYFHVYDRSIDGTDFDPSMSSQVIGAHIFY